MFFLSLLMCVPLGLQPLSPTRQRFHVPLSLQLRPIYMICKLRTCFRFVDDFGPCVHVEMVCRVVPRGCNVNWKRRDTATRWWRFRSCCVVSNVNFVFSVYTSRWSKFGDEVKNQDIRVFGCAAADVQFLKSLLASVPSLLVNEIRNIQQSIRGIFCSWDSVAKPGISVSSLAELPWVWTLTRSVHNQLC